MAEQAKAVADKPEAFRKAELAWAERWGVAEEVQRKIREEAKLPLDKTK